MVKGEDDYARIRTVDEQLGPELATNSALKPKRQPILKNVKLII